MISQNCSVDSFNVLIGFSQNEISQMTVNHLMAFPRMKLNKLAEIPVSLKQPISQTTALLACMWVVSMHVGSHVWSVAVTELEILLPLKLDLRDTTCAFKIISEYTMHCTCRYISWSNGLDARTILIHEDQLLY